MSKVSDSTMPNGYVSSCNNLSDLILNEADSDLLEVVAVTYSPTLSDEVFDVIRAIVPPPPPAHPCLSNGDRNWENIISSNTNESPERLYSRRSSEGCLLRRLKSQSSSAKEARINLEELFFQIIEPKKYTNQEFVMHTILEVMEVWSKEEAIQQLALSSFMCLSQQCDIFHLSEQAALSIVNSMKLFHTNETVQRIGVKVLKDKRVLQQIQNKDEVACVVFNALCHLHHVNDFIVYAKDIVEEVSSKGRMHLRASKSYVDMLLSFPYREDVTIYLSWCALDILTLLADSQEKWDMLLNLNGQSRIERLSQRPEFENRCKTLLERAFLKQYNVMRENISPLNGDMASLSKANANFASKPVTQLLKLSDSLKLTGSRIYSDISIECKMKGMEENEPTTKMKGNGITSESGGRNMILLRNDEVGTRRPLTPPTVVDFKIWDGGKFSDDCKDIDHELLSKNSYGYCSILSPSYSPPPEPLAHYEEELQELFSPGPSIGDHLVTEKKSSGRIHDCTIENIVDQGFSQAVTMHTLKPLPNGKLGSVYPCFICREPKVKQYLLMKQLNQISHCLHQPCNKLLLKCLRSNVCGDHKM